MQVLCPILGRPTTAEPTPFSRGQWKILRCRETNFVFLQDPPDYSRLESEFAWEITARVEKQRRREAEPVISRVSLLAKHTKYRLFPKRNRFFTLASAQLPKTTSAAPIRLLDIGCGMGGLLKELCSRFQQQNQTVIPSGIEVSINSAKVAQGVVSPLGGQVIQANALDGTATLEAKSLDVVVMSSFLEHESQPLLLLQRLRAALADHAIIVLKVPNFACVNRVLRGNKWCGFRFPDHTNYFTPATLRCLAAEAGFVCQQSFLDKLPSSDTMYAVLKKSGSAMAN